MNESQLPGLVEDFQDDALSEANCRELMDWFDEDESRVLPFVDELRVGNAFAALQVMDSARLPSAGPRPRPSQRPTHPRSSHSR